MIQTALLKWVFVIIVSVFAISFFLMKITDSVGEANFNKGYAQSYIDSHKKPYFKEDTTNHKPHLLPLRPSYKFFLNPYCKEMKVLKIFPDTVVVADAKTIIYDDY